MKLDANEIGRLRRRLGLSVAELARRMACDSSAIEAWESGVGSPGARELVRLQTLAEHADACADRVALGPAAEAHMEENALCQAAGRDFLI